MMRVEFHPAAAREVVASQRWYGRSNPSAAAGFAQEIDAAVIEITTNPGLPALYLSGTRRVLLRRFPYPIVYKEMSDYVLVIAVAHGSRRPGYWRRRLT